MAFTRVNPLGWALYEELTSAQMNQLDLNVSRAIDGAAGGTYNLSSDLIINGTMQVTNLVFESVVSDSLEVDNLVVNNSSILNGTTTINDALTVNAATTWTGDATVSGVWIFDNGTSTSAQVIFRGGFVWFDDANIRIDNKVNFTSTAVVNVVDGVTWEFNNTPEFANGLLVSSGTAQVDDGLTVTGPVTFDIGSDDFIVNATTGDVDFTDADQFRMPAAVEFDGTYIEYASDETIQKRFPAPQLVGDIGSWDVNTTCLTTTFDGGLCWCCLALPRRCTAVSVTVYYEGDANPTSDGFTIALGSKITNGDYTSLDEKILALASHNGTGIITVSSTISGASAQMWLELMAPSGGSGNFKIHEFSVTPTLKGMGSW